MKVLAPLALLLTLLPTVAQGAPDAETQKWLDLAAEHYRQSPYSLDYSMDMTMQQQGAVVTISGAGNILVGKASTVRMLLDLSMAMPPMLPDPIEISTLVVNDGKTVWTEMDNPLMGGKQVSKVSVEDAAKLAKKSGMMAGMDPSRLDPAAQLEVFTEMADLKLQGVSNGKVRLAGPMTKEFRANFGAVVDQLGDGDLSLVLVEKTGEIMEVRFGSATSPLATIRYETMKLLQPKDVPPGSFSYTPPPGVAVTDLGATQAPEGK